MGLFHPATSFSNYSFQTIFNADLLKGNATLLLHSCDAVAEMESFIKLIYNFIILESEISSNVHKVAN